MTVALSSLPNKLQTLEQRKTRGADVIAGISIRLATAQDAESVCATLHDAFAQFEPLYTPAGFRATTPAASEIERRFAEGPIWVAESAGYVVGTVSACRVVRTSISGVWPSDQTPRHAVSVCGFCT
ncbi:MAG: GNAT family N-acetyltransferase [Gemmatimonadaceae bacterium]